MSRTFLLGSLTLALPLFLACSATDGADGADAGTGGTTDTGGSGSSTGGGPGSGGIGNTGGSMTGGSNTGGNVGSGGDGSGGAPVDNCTPSSGTEDVGTSSLRDKATCLTWQKASTASLNHTNGSKHCADLVQDGYDDWRMSTAAELKSWPNVSDAGQYVTGPSFVGPETTDVQFACVSNSHSCNLVWWDGSTPSCNWNGQGTIGTVVCVRGTTEVALDAAFSRENCGQCGSNEALAFEEVDCAPYGQ